MSIWVKVLVCFLASTGAGLGTGFAGMSAAVVITPMLATFLGFDTYQAIGIALASDVIASAVSAYTYKKNKNLDIKNGLIMMACVLAFTVIGSYISKYVPNRAMGNFSVVMTTFMGIRFLVSPVQTTREKMGEKSKKRKITESVILGCMIGFWCGFLGAGGGMMMLFALTTVLGYELKCAVGTSVFIMTFTALTGSISHFAIGGKPDIACMIMCIVFTFVWARAAAVIANKVSTKTLNRAMGVILTSVGVAVIGVNLYKNFGGMSFIDIISDIKLRLS